MTVKKCTKCGEEKALSEYGVKKASKSGYRSACKVCTSEWHKANYVANRDAILKRTNEYNATHTEERSARMKKIYKEKTAEYSARNKRWKEANPDVLATSSRALYLKNRENILEKAKGNRDHINSVGRVRAKERRKNDEAFRVKCAIKSRLGIFYRANGQMKSDSSEALLGGSWDTVMDHLKRQGYTEGMHIDHIVPLANFDIMQEDHRSIMFDYRNLQPLPAFDNLSKGAKLPTNWEATVIALCAAKGIDHAPIIKHIQ